MWALLPRGDFEEATPDWLKLKRVLFSDARNWYKIKSGFSHSNLSGVNLMSAPGGFGTAGGSDGTGPPTKRPKMEQENDLNPTQNQNMNPLDNIFGTPNDSSGGLPDELIPESVLLRIIFKKKIRERIYESENYEERKNIYQDKNSEKL